MSTQRVIPQTWQGTLGRGLLVLAVFFVYVMAASSSAQAGTYYTAQCSSANPAAQEAVLATNTAAYTPYQCGSSFGTSFVANQSIGCACTAYAYWTLTAPAGTVFRSISLVGIFDSAGGGSGSHSTAISVVADGGGVPAGPWGDLYGTANPGQPTNFQTGTMSDATAARTLSEVIACAGTCNGFAYVGMYNMTLELSDVSAPAVPSVGGELAGDGVHRGTETLTGTGTDIGGGVYQASVDVNGTQVDAQTFPCDFSGGYAINFHPCAKNRAFSFDLNTEAAPWHDGQNVLETCVSDLATSNSPNTTCEQRTVVVDNGCTPSTSIGAAASSIQAGLKQKNGNLEKSVLVKSTDGVPLEGTLGGGVAGATICLYETLDVPGQPRQIAQTVKTKAGGQFAAQLAAGPSRSVDVVYRYNNKLLEDHVKMDSEVVPDLHFKKRKLRNGKTMRFKGAIPGPFADGRAVTVQAKVGKQWRTFKQLTTDLEGKFAGRYRFKHSTLPRAVYRFRVLVKKQTGYPYEAGHSKRKKVIVFN